LALDWVGGGLKAVRRLLKLQRLFTALPFSTAYLLCMPTRRKLLMTAITTALLLASVAISPEIGSLFAFVFVSTAVLMCLEGFRVPGFVKRRRRELAEQAARSSNSPDQVRQDEADLRRQAWSGLLRRDVTPASYRLQINWFGKLILYVTGLVPLCLGVLMLFAAARQIEARNHLIVLGFWTTLFGMAMTRYARACTRQFVRVDAAGLEAEQFWGVVRMNWDDIVAIAQSTLRMMTQAVLTEHIIFSRDRSIRIPAKLENRDELMATIIENAP
jgi:hypothetical protein